jgi:cytochrome c-type biogenesis protein CcmF
MALGAWLVFGSLVDLANRIALFRAPLSISLSRLAGLPRSSLGMTLAHTGLGLMIIGIIAITLWKVEHIVAMKPGDRAEVGSYTVEFKGETPLTGGQRCFRKARVQTRRHANNRSWPASNPVRRCLRGDG